MINIRGMRNAQVAESSEIALLGFHSNKKRDTPLQMICRSGKIDALQILIQQTSIDFTDSSDNTFLHIACSYGKKEIVEWLINHGANPCLQNSNGDLPHHLLFTDNARIHRDGVHNNVICIGMDNGRFEFENVVIEIMKLLGISRLSKIQIVLVIQLFIWLVEMDTVLFCSTLYHVSNLMQLLV